MESNAASRNFSSLEGWNMITCCGVCLDGVAHGSATDDTSCEYLPAGEMPAPQRGACTQFRGLAASCFPSGK